VGHRGQTGFQGAEAGALSGRARRLPRPPRARGPTLRRRPEVREPRTQEAGHRPTGEEMTATLTDPPAAAPEANAAPAPWLTDLLRGLRVVMTADVMIEPPPPNTAFDDLKRVREMIAPMRSVEDYIREIQFVNLFAKADG